MVKVLYVTANPKSTGNSISHRVKQAFLQAYRHFHTNDAIREINLYEEDFPVLSD
ncbi:NAD(P)H-dependent oxidoreductase [Priestia megaterium]|uniref:NAD(P)H-dependent oxidoreductase n=1 Tax=Priestia megaterium TaxID=1404 RepID=UPI00244CCB95|nr:NAD(P)H-dependent oxidoreductase [Priestia megaterium]MDH2363211.1 NAD(P)H-dependent oxidoreductase [Priestia megaterium]